MTTALSNVYKYGDLTDTNGVLSYFYTNYYYALIPNIFNPGSTSFEWVMKFTTGSNTRTQYISGREFYFDLYISNGKMCLDFGNGSGWEVVVQEGTTQLSSSTTYYVKLVYSGTDYKLYLSTTSTFGSTPEITVNRSTPLVAYQIPIGNLISSQTAFQGSVDLNECYINIGGQRWWTGMTECNVNAVGSPSCANGILTGLTYNNYAYSDIIFNPGNDIWEIGTKVIYADTGSHQDVIASYSPNSGIGNLIIRRQTDGTIILYMATSSQTTWDIAGGVQGSAVYSYNTPYYLKLSYTGTQYKLDYSTDGITFYNDITVNNSSDKIYNQIPINLGCHRYGSSTDAYMGADGKIDLNNTYISINNAVVWRGITQPSPVSSGVPKLGTNDIEKIYLGSQEIEKIYLGDEVIYNAV